MEENKTLFRLTDLRDKKEIGEVRSYLSKLAQIKPDGKILVFYACAGHGMQMDGEEVLIINSFNESIGYYDWWNVESDIRRMAGKYPNTYSVAIFACCREIYKPTRHCGLFGGSVEAAREFFKKIALDETEAEFAKSDIAKETARKRKKEIEVQKFKQIQVIEENKIKAKCKENQNLKTMK